MVLEDADLERVEELASQGDDPLVVERLLAALPAEQRDAVWARVLDERSYPDIAVELRCSEAVVRQRVHRGTQSGRLGREAMFELISGGEAAAVGAA